MNKKLKILYITNGIFIVAGALLGPLYAIYVATFSVSVFMISLTWAVMLFTGLITFYLISKQAKDDESTNLNFIIWGYLISAVSWLLFAFTTNFYQLFFIQAILGVGLALGGPSWNSLVASHLDKGKHVHDFAEWSMVSKFIEFFSVLFGGLIIVTVGFDALFIAMFFIGVISALLLVTLKKSVFTKSV